MPYDPDHDRHYLLPRESLRLQLAALRSEQKGERYPGGTPLGGDLRGPCRSKDYPELVVKALQYAWTWRDNALPE